MSTPDIIKKLEEIRALSRLIEEAEEAGFDGKQLVEDIFINNPRECFTFKKG